MKKKDNLEKLMDKLTINKLVDFEQSDLKELKDYLKLLTHHHRMIEILNIKLYSKKWV